MHIEYEISERDFIAAQNLAIKNSPVRFVRWTRFVIPLFGLALLLFLVYAAERQGVSWRLLPGLAVCLFFISLPVLSRRTQRALYAKSTAMPGRLSLDIGDDGLLLQGPTFSSQIRWSNFPKFFEDGKSFVLYQNQRTFNFVPKRNLAPDQIKTLREYLERNIGRAG